MGVQNSKVGAQPLTEANRIRLKRLYEEVGAWRTLGALASQAAEEEGVEHPSGLGAAQTLRKALNGESISEWSMQYVLVAINKLDDTPVQQGNGKHHPPHSAKEVQAIEDWKEKYEQKREENVRLTGELRALKVQMDELHRELTQAKADLDHVRYEQEDVATMLQEVVLSDTDVDDFATVQVKAARWLIARQITNEANNS